MSDLRPESLTWTGLLARWVEFAQAAVASPEDDEGERWRSSVVAIIQLQAVTFALAELGELQHDERALGRDRAELLIAASCRELNAAWRGANMPPTLLEMCADARLALAASRYAGAIELTAGGDQPITMPVVQPPEAGPLILAVMQPGTIVMPGEPVAWWVCGAEAFDWAPPMQVERHSVAVPRQVYRQLNDAGRITRDVVLPVTADPVPGVPLLVVLRDEGEACGTFTRDAAEWEAQQRAAMDGESVEVVVD